MNGALTVPTLSARWGFLWLLCRVRVIRSEGDVLVVCPTILTEDGMQAQHLGATLALYRLAKGQVSGRPGRSLSPKAMSVCTAVRAGFWPLGHFSLY